MVGSHKPDCEREVWKEQPLRMDDTTDAGARMPIDCLRQGEETDCLGLALRKGNGEWVCKGGWRRGNAEEMETLEYVSGVVVLAFDAYALIKKSSLNSFS